MGSNCHLALLHARAISWSNSGRPTTPTSQSAPKRQGFFDYALGKINPHGIDYGASMESGRNAVVENTIDDLYFWSNVVTLLLLSGLVAIVLLQWRAADKREVIAASLIAQLWNGRVSDRIEIERRTQQFNQLVEAHNADVEKNLSQKPGPSQQDAEAAGSLTRSVRSLADEQRNLAGGGGEDRSLGARCNHSEPAAKQSPVAAARGSAAEQRTESQTAPEPNDRPARPGTAPQRNSQGRLKGPE